MSRPIWAREDKIPGLTVISPTWFAVTDSRGTVGSKADWKYVQDAHDKGYKVWALISNSFEPDMTKSFLADESAQDRAVRQILMYTALYDLDGINIDFENVYDDDSDRLTGFVARLAEKLKEQGVLVSLDATVPSGVPMWSNCYDRAALAKIVDYYMVMTYDEHWRTSPVAGSVASIGCGGARHHQYPAVCSQRKIADGCAFLHQGMAGNRAGLRPGQSPVVHPVDVRCGRPCGPIQLDAAMA